MDAASRSATEPTKALVPEIIDAGTGSLAEELARLRDEQGDPAELTDEEILELHEAADAELERAVRAVRSYALMAYQIGRALAGRKAKLKRGQYTPWVTKTLRFRDRTARRYRFIFEGLEALAARSGQHWPLTVLDLPVDKLESFLRKALKPGDSSKGGGSDSAASTEPDAGEDGDDHRDADTDEDADREDEDADADDEEDEAAGEPEAKAEAEDGDDEHDGDRSTSATETDEHEDADEGDAGDDDGDDEGGGDLLREFERVTQSSHGGFRRAGK